MTIITDPVPESQLGPVTHDDRTSGGLPLPHPDNSARRDAVRLRASLILLESRLTGVITETQVQGLIDAAVADLLDSAPGALDTLNELASAIGDDPNFAATITNALAGKASKDSPTFTGTVTVPTPAPTSNTTAAASTAYVQRELDRIAYEYQRYFGI